jgi:hypothetical protein
MVRRDRNLPPEESNIIQDGLFGGILSMPIPVPEIISSLDRTTFKRKQRQA